MGRRSLLARAIRAQERNRRRLEKLRAEIARDAVENPPRECIECRSLELCRMDCWLAPWNLEGLDLEDPDPE